MARTAYSCHVAGRNCMGPTARSNWGSLSSAPWSVSGTAGYPWLPSSSGPRIRGLATPDQLGLEDPPLRAWSDSIRPIPASTDQLRWQFGAALASVCAASMYAARASRGIVPEPDHVGTAVDKVTGPGEGRPTDAGCRATAGTSQAAGATPTLGVTSGSALTDDGAADATGYVTPASASFTTGRAAAFAIAGGRGKPPELWGITNAAAQNAIAAAAPHACARGTVRRTREWRAATARAPCFELLACCALRTCRGSATRRTGSGARRI
jgi:hypothetical protein